MDNYYKHPCNSHCMYTSVQENKQTTTKRIDRRKRIVEIIKLTNITKIYGTGTSQTVALKDVNLSINKGEFLSIMGPSGSGKSTLLNILGCMDIPTNGEYYLKGDLINRCSNRKLGKIRNSDVSFVFQHFALMKDYNVFENVKLPLNCKKMSARKRKESVFKYLEKLGIADLAKKLPSQISGGQQQRAAIARALVSESDIILADEPTGALDQKTGEDLLNLLTEINQSGKTIIVITHDSKIASYTQRTINIIDGKIDLH